jgi:hypothetical protein
MISFPHAHHSCPIPDNWSCPSMTEKAMTLALEENDDGFTLRRTDADGTVSEMRLADADVTTLGLAAIALQQRILTRQATPASSAIAAVTVMDVARVRLNVDALGEVILLTLISPQGLETAFALPRDNAESLIAQLPFLLQKMKAANPTQKQ